MNIIKKIYCRATDPSQSRLNIFKTFYINFKTQPFKVAVKFPIIVYGKCTLLHLKKGSIKLNNPHFKSVIIGYNEGFSNQKCGTRFRIDGSITFNGRAIICIDNTIENSGQIILGNDLYLGGGCKMFCHNKITIGNDVHIAFESTIFDTDFHYIINVSNGLIKKRWKEIRIGNNVWIGHRSAIMKGACLPNYSIVTARSLINKDFGSYPEATVFAGSPAKNIRVGYKRLLDVNIEHILDDWFRQNAVEQIEWEDFDCEIQ